MQLRLWAAWAAWLLCADSAAALKARQRDAASELGASAGDAGAGKQVLLVLAGVLRDFTETWPYIEEKLVRPNEMQGYTFTIVVQTTLKCSCSQLYDPMIQAKSEDWRRLVLRATFGGRNHSYMDSHETCESQGHGMSLHSYFAEPRAVHCGTQHFAARSVQALDAFARDRSFSKIVVMRPDLLIFDFGGRGLLFDRVCKEYPGVSVVTGRCDNICTGFHWNDFDMAWLLCDGREHAVFREALANVGKKCEGSDCEEGRVQLPSDFHPMQKAVLSNGTRAPQEVQWSCDYEPMMCRTIQLLGERKVRFGTLEADGIYVGKNQESTRKCTCR